MCTFHFALASKYFYKSTKKNPNSEISRQSSKTLKNSAILLLDLVICRGERVSQNHKAIHLFPVQMVPIFFCPYTLANKIKLQMLLRPLLRSPDYYSVMATASQESIFLL